MTATETDIRYMYETVDDAIASLRNQADMTEMAARAEKTEKYSRRTLARAQALRDAADMLDHAWIDEIDGDRRTATERGRKIRR